MEGWASYLEPGTSSVNVASRDVILLAHAAFGVLGTLSALWVFVEALNAQQENAGRIRTSAPIYSILYGASGDSRWLLVYESLFG